MADTDVLTLPLLSLNRGVVLPNMVVTVAIESPEASDAIAAALNGPGRLFSWCRRSMAFTRASGS